MLVFLRISENELSMGFFFRLIFREFRFIPFDSCKIKRLFVLLPARSSLSKILFFGILIILSTFSRVDATKDIWLSNLDYNNPQIKQLREDIKFNLKISKSQFEENKLLPIIYYKYKIKKKDTFYKIMAFTGMDIDTLSSVNDLSSPMDIYQGMELKIPNCRGVFISAAKLNEKIKIRPDLAVFDTEKNMWFVAGAKLNKQEKSFFYGFAFMRPLEGGKTSSGFGYRNDPFTNRLTFHGGVDIAAVENAPVFSAANGEVVFAGRKGGYGNLVIIKHKLGYETLYGHLNSILVQSGAKINKGELIAKVGSTGKSTGFHLHFEVRRFSKRQRPVFHVFLNLSNQ